MPRFKQSHLTERALLIYDFIVTYMTRHHGLSPTIREIQTACAIPSTSVVFWHLQKLAAKDRIAFHQPENGKRTMNRNIFLPGATWTPPAQ